MKRIAIVLILGLIAVGAFAGGSQEAADSVDELGGTITFWVMPNAPDETHMPWIEEKAAEFYELTGVTVEYEIVGWGDAWTKISTAVATGEGVDVFQVGTTWNPQFAATSGLEMIDINEFGGKDAFMKANYDSTTLDGTCYGVPWFAETRVLFYNKDMFEKAGATPPKTHEELYAAADKIIAEYGEGSAIALAGTNAWDLIHNWAIILWGNGGQMLDDSNEKALLNSPEGVKAMQWYVDLVRNGYAAKACAEYNQPQADAAFINGNVAMCYMGPWNISNIEQENPGLNYGIVEPPKGPKGEASFSGGSNLVVLKESRNKAAAKEWIKFLLEEDQIVEYTSSLSKMLPSKKDAYNNAAFDTDRWQLFKNVLSYSTAYAPLGVWGDIENAIVTEFKGVLIDYINGDYTDSTVKTHLDAAASKVDSALGKE
ncbi:MAG: extracellular solute-binding protein [Spirochaetales bacterium]|uniref:Extracellular solute-binding protein n=1 Tax=Candidatus Thalassospirochaeta sargassi TaxID=3119039 RepID=A0AAJ1MJR4_9SPIO|nr:extracellular solute-binding protein [Spirochaetales bacterium]